MKHRNSKFTYMVFIIIITAELNITQPPACMENGLSAELVIASDYHGYVDFIFKLYARPFVWRLFYLDLQVKTRIIL